MSQKPSRARRPRMASDVAQVGAAVVAPTVDAEPAQFTANANCLRQYAVGYTGGTPRRLALGGRELWIVPAVLTSAGYGVVGELGVVAVDAVGGEVVGATPRDEVRAAGAELNREKQDVLRAAVLRAVSGRRALSLSSGRLRTHRES